MVLQVNNNALALKVQPTINTDSLPTVIANAMAVGNLQEPSPSNNTIERVRDTGTSGFKGNVHINKHLVMPPWNLPLVGSGVDAVTPPLWRPAALMSGHAETILVDRVRYTPVDSGHGQATWYSWHDNQFFQSLNARGSFGFNITTDDESLINMSNTFGSYITPITSAQPAGLDLSAWPQLGLPISNSNQALASIAGRNADCATYQVSQFSFSQNLEIEPRDYGGCEIVLVGNRQPTINLTIIAEDLNNENWYERAINDLPFTFAYTLGTVTGNIFFFEANQCQVSDIQPGEDGPAKTYQITATCNELNGGDDYAFGTL